MLVFFLFFYIFININNINEWNWLHGRIVIRLNMKYILFSFRIFSYIYMKNILFFFYFQEHLFHIFVVNI